ncbi:MAG: NusA-like transcription termination signal-binding factor [Methanosarcinales archaeon Met12]|nr:MAG: NusA-like transcription termination signal-binding factor [Methanosarcinales archaeon Met12]
MSKVKLTSEGMRYIALLESLTGAVTRDCVIDEDNTRVIFVIKKGEMGIAIGKKGCNINRVKKAIGKHIEIVEYSEDADEFIRNSFLPATIQKMSIRNEDGKRLAYVEILPNDKGIVIGRNGRNIQKARILAERHHGIDDIVIQ